MLEDVAKSLSLRSVGTVPRSGLGAAEANMGKALQRLCAKRFSENTVQTDEPMSF